MANGASGNAGTAKKARKKAGKRAADGKQNQGSNPLAEGGNVPVKPYKFSAEEESAILRDVKVADGFDVTLFAAPPMVNYPVFVAAERMAHSMSVAMATVRWAENPTADA